MAQLLHLELCPSQLLLAARQQLLPAFKKRDRLFQGELFLFQTLHHSFQFLQGSLETQFLLTAQLALLFVLYYCCVELAAVHLHQQRVSSMHLRGILDHDLGIRPAHDGIAPRQRSQRTDSRHGSLQSG